MEQFTQPPVTRAEIENDLEAVAGRDIIHRLTEQEIQQYVRVVQLEDTFELARSLLVQDLAAGHSASYIEAMISGTHHSNQTVFDPGEVDIFWKAQAEHLLAKQQFWFHIRNGRNCWNKHLSIAAGFTVVALGNKLRTE